LLYLVAGTFLSVIAVIVGSYWLLVVSPEDRSQQAVRKRLKPDHRAAAIRTGLLKEAERLSHVATLESLLQRAGNVIEPLQKLIHQAGLKTSVSVIVLSCGCCALAVGLLTHTLTHIASAAVVAGIVAAPAPIMVLRSLRTRRLLKFEEQFPETIDLIARALRAGHAFTTGLSMVADEAPEPIGGEFRLLYEQQNFGMPLPDAMRGFATRIPILDAQFFATAVLTQRESGGNLAEVLDNLGSVIRERFRVKRQVRVISAHGRLTGWILALLPPGLACAFLLSSRTHIQTLINDPLGVRMIIAAVALQLLGSYIISKIVKIEY
jgi:tight adherence protein B